MKVTEAVQEILGPERGIELIDTMGLRWAVVVAMASHRQKAKHQAAMKVISKWVSDNARLPA